MSEINPNVADLFSPDSVRQGEALDALADAFAQLVKSPGWQLYRDYVERVRRVMAFDYAEGGDPAKVLHMQGFILGLKQSVESVETLVERARRRAQKRQDDEEEKERVRRRLTSLSGRGGI